MGSIMYTFTLALFVHLTTGVQGCPDYCETCEPPDPKDCCISGYYYRSNFTGEDNPVTTSSVIPDYCDKCEVIIQDCLECEQRNASVEPLCRRCDKELVVSNNKCVVPQRGDHIPTTGIIKILLPTLFISAGFMFVLVFLIIRKMKPRRNDKPSLPTVDQLNWPPLNTTSNTQQVDNSPRYIGNTGHSVARPGVNGASQSQQAVASVYYNSSAPDSTVEFWQTNVAERAQQRAGVVRTNCRPTNVNSAQPVTEILQVSENADVDVSVDSAVDNYPLDNEIYANTCSLPTTQPPQTQQHQAFSDVTEHHDDDGNEVYSNQAEILNLQSIRHDQGITKHGEESQEIYDNLKET